MPPAADSGGGLRKQRMQKPPTGAVSAPAAGVNMPVAVQKFVQMAVVVGLVYRSARKNGLEQSAAYRSFHSIVRWVGS